MGSLDLYWPLPPTPAAQTIWQWALHCSNPSSTLTEVMWAAQLGTRDTHLPALGPGLKSFNDGLWPSIMLKFPCLWYITLCKPMTLVYYLLDIRGHVFEVQHLEMFSKTSLRMWYCIRQKSVCNLLYLMWPYTITKATEINRKILKVEGKILTLKRLLCSQSQRNFSIL